MMKSSQPVDAIEVGEWQVAGIRRAIASLDRGEGVPHEQVRNWVSDSKRPIPKTGER
jgi:RHH-type transcriptional regulator, rel operon repressor / antitoxin RelB